MRYPEDKIKDAILHPDLDVRDTAIRYFYSSTNPDHSLMPLPIQAIEWYGRTNTHAMPRKRNNQSDKRPAQVRWAFDPHIPTDDFFDGRDLHDLWDLQEAVDNIRRSGFPA
jgi:hypothetical protein